MKQGQVGFKWFGAIIAFFVVGLFFLILNNVWSDNLMPALTGQLNTSSLNATQQASVIASTDKFFDFWNFLPWFILIVVVVYIFILALKNEETSYG